MVQSLWASPILAENVEEVETLEEEIKLPLLLNDGRIVKGRTLVPAKSILEALGAEVEWDGATRTVTITGDKSMVLQIDSKIVTVDGVEYTLDVPAQIINGKTMVPIRFIGESFGAEVQWDQENQMATILTPEITIMVGIDQIVKVWDMGPNGFDINEHRDLNGDGKPDTLRITGGKGNKLSIFVESNDQSVEYTSEPDSIVSQKMMLTDLHNNGKLQLLEVQKNVNDGDYYLDAYTFVQGEFDLVAGLLPLNEEYYISRNKVISGDIEYVFTGTGFVDRGGSKVGEVTTVTEDEQNSSNQPSQKPKKQQGTFNGKTVTEGMSRDQVYQILGKPTEIKPDLESQAMFKKMFGFESPMIQWNYIKRSGGMTVEILAVVFMNGKAESFVYYGN
ncbi:hypothetical protein EIZ39_20185 [Ammoniphilus sp. CFH 90114]|nr:hypothetical protein EIZ39_20185 [Ammoniphilus sp. CFH 90114]